MNQKVWAHVLDKYRINNKIDLTPSKNRGVYLFGEEGKNKLKIFNNATGFSNIDISELNKSNWLKKEYEKWRIAKTMSGCSQLWEDWISYESSKINPGRLTLEENTSCTKMIEVACPECGWTDHPGRYIGAFTDEPCKKCGGKGVCVQAVPHKESNFKMKNTPQSTSKAFSKSFSGWGSDYLDYVYNGQDQYDDDDCWF